MSDCLIGLGCNLGDCDATFDAAVACFAAHPQISVLSQSRRRRTAPIGGPAGQGSHLNAALRITTQLSSQALLDFLLDTQQQLGRQQRERWAAREIDLDLLLYDEKVVTTDRLHVPHPRMAFRRFVLEPAAEIAPDMVHPTTGWAVQRLLDHLDTAADYIAIGGLSPRRNAEVARRAADHVGGRFITTGDAREMLSLLAGAVDNSWEPVANELLRRRVEQLASADADGANGEAVSDFWVGDTTALARAALSAAQFESFCEATAAMTSKTATPKLLVLCDCETEHYLEDFSETLGDQATPPNREAVDRFRAALLAEASQPKNGPVLHLSDGDLEQTVSEVAAAIEGMR